LKAFHLIFLEIEVGKIDDFVGCRAIVLEIPPRVCASRATRQKILTGESFQALPQRSFVPAQLGVSSHERILLANSFGVIYHSQKTKRRMICYVA